MRGLPVLTDPNVIRGMESLDNAGVYKLTSELAIIQTVDFFTPVVDDPYMFGQIAVANSLSDVYTMGGKPITALNLVCFPVQTMDISVLRDILRGGSDKMAEAGVVLVGGHSVDDQELKYGLSVTGVVHPDKLITNGSARPGDWLVLTKPLGTGIINTALKVALARTETVARVTASMATLNARASAIMQELGAHAATDITGFGFIGHTVQMAQNSKVGFHINAAAIPVFPEALELAGKGICPGGLYRNREFYTPCVDFADDVTAPIQDILFDPQTSGGRLISLEAARAQILVGRLTEAGVTEAAVIGKVVPEPAGKLVISGGGTAS